MTPRNFLIRGLLAGFVAGLLTFAVAYVVGEPQVDTAIAFEEANSTAPAMDQPTHVHDESAATGHHHDEGGTVVSRANQSTWGLLTGTLGVAIALGGGIGLVSAFAVGRFGRLRPEQTTLLVTGIGFVAVVLVPFLNYPANPPAVGDPNTIGVRSVAYFSLLAISVIAAIAATELSRRLTIRGVYRATLIACGAYIALMVVVGTALPTVNEVGDFPADTLWYFRSASLATLTTMWLTLGIVTATLVYRLHHREALRTTQRDLATSL